MAKQQIELKPIFASYVQQKEFESKLKSLTRKMLKDINDSIIDSYRVHIKTIKNIVNDENPIDILLKLLNKKINKWVKIFDDFSNTYSQNLVNDIDTRTKNVLTSGLKDFADKITIKFDNKNQSILLAKNSVIKENIALIKSIPERLHDRIEIPLIQSMQRGRDIKYFQEQLKNIYGITSRQANNIARDQINKATEVIANARKLEIGITQSKWKHSHAGKKPRISHQKADGKIYDNSKGCYIDNEYIYPAQLINCRCFATPIFNL